MKFLLPILNMMLMVVGCTCVGLYIGDHSYGFAGFWAGIVLVSAISLTVMMAKEKTP